MNWLNLCVCFVLYRHQVDQQVFLDAVSRYGTVPADDPDRKKDDEPLYLDVSIPIMRRSDLRSPGSLAGEWGGMERRRNGEEWNDERMGWDGAICGTGVMASWV